MNDILAKRLGTKNELLRNFQHNIIIKHLCVWLRNCTAERFQHVLFHDRFFAATGYFILF